MKPLYSYISLICTICLCVLVSPHAVAQIDDSRVEDFTHRNVYTWNEEQQDWVLRQTSEYMFSDTGRTIISEFFSDICPTCPPTNYKTYISYDELGRTHKVEFWDNEGGSSSLYIKLRIEYSHFQETDLITDKKVYAVNFDSEFLLEHTYRVFNGTGDILTYYHKESNNVRDSIAYEYDDAGKLTVQTQYAWNLIDCCNNGWKPLYKYTCNYNGQYLENIEVEFMNSGTEEWIKYVKITDIEEPNLMVKAKQAKLNKDEMPDWASKSGAFGLGMNTTLGGANGLDLKALFFNKLVNSKNFKQSKFDWELGVYKLKILTKIESSPTVFIITSENLDKGTKVVAEFHNWFSIINALAKHETNQFCDNSGCYEMELFNITITDFNGVIKHGSTQVIPEDQIFTFWFPQKPKNEIENKSATMDRVLRLTHQQYNSEKEAYENWVKQEYFYNGERIYNSVEDNAIENKLVVYPNPAQGILQFTLNNQPGPATIELVNTLGQTVLMEQVQISSSNYQYSKNVVHLESGVYILKVSTGSGSNSQKIIIQ